MTTNTKIYLGAGLVAVLLILLLQKCSNQHSLQSTVASAVKINTNNAGVSSFDFKTDFKHTTGVWDSSGYIRITDTTVVPITVVPYWKRKYEVFGIGFGKIYHYIDASSTNPAVRITAAQDVKFTMHDPSRFGLSGFVGYDIFKRWTVGAGVTYTFVRF